MKIIYKAIDEVKEYENNPRDNSEAVAFVAESIEKYGFKVPIIIDKNGVIVAGHTRYKAAIQLGLAEIPCIVADDLNDEQIKAFRLADNKVAEMAEWDFALLVGELAELKEGCEGLNLTGFEDWEIESILNPIISEDLNDFFVDKEQKEKTPKMVQCPCCGGWFEE